MNLRKFLTVMDPPCCQGIPVVWLQPLSSEMALCSHGVLLLLLQFHICWDNSCMDSAHVVYSQDEIMTLLWPGYCNCYCSYSSSESGALFFGKQTFFLITTLTQDVCNNTELPVVPLHACNRSWKCLTLHVWNSACHGKPLVLYFLSGKIRVCHVTWYRATNCCTTFSWWALSLLPLLQIYWICVL